MFLKKRSRIFQKKINHPTQKTKYQIKKTLRRLGKLPLIIRYFVGIIFLGIGFVGIINPLLPGWLFLLVGAKMLSPRYYRSMVKLLKKTQPQSYQKQLFELLSKKI